MSHEESHWTVKDGPARIVFEKNHYERVPTLTTVDEHGEEHHWELMSTTRHNGEEISEHDTAEQSNDYAFRRGEWCEWPVAGQWRSSTTCARGAATRVDGLALCWQHEDAAFGHVLARLRDGDLTPLQIEKLSYDLLKTDETLGGYQGIFGRVETNPLVFTAVKNYLEAVLESKFARRGAISELLDQVIEKRLQNQWGETA